MREEMLKSSAMPIDQKSRVCGTNWAARSVDLSQEATFASHSRFADYAYVLQHFRAEESYLGSCGESSAKATQSIPAS
jgi:hypothetical protein